MEWHSLRFETEWMAECDNFQGNAVVNYTDAETPYTRIIEHKALRLWPPAGHGGHAGVPGGIRGEEGALLPGERRAEHGVVRPLPAAGRAVGRKVLFGGRLGEYRYYNMDEVVCRALDLAASLLN